MVNSVTVGNELVNTGKASASQVVAAIVRIFGVHVFSFEPNIESRDMSWESSRSRPVLKLALPPSVEQD